MLFRARLADVKIDATLKHDKGFLDRMFTHLPMNPLGLDILLKVTATKLGHLMHDDCTAVTLEKKVSS